MNGPTTSRPDVWVSVGLAVTATAAAVSSFSGLRALALATGWPSWLSVLLPLTIDAYAMSATRLWLAASTRSVRARRLARWNAIGAISLSLAGNAVSHLIDAQLLVPGWLVVLVVGAVPPVVLGLVSHLAVLHTQIDTPLREDSDRTRTGATPDTASRAAVRTDDRPRYMIGDELYAAARRADQVHRAETGRPISRDELRRVLGIGGARATVVARMLKQESASPSPDEVGRDS